LWGIPIFAKQLYERYFTGGEQPKTAALDSTTSRALPNGNITVAFCVVHWSARADFDEKCNRAD
jgi:hypothetical protein